jgi:hypothetical protein
MIDTFVCFINSDVIGEPTMCLGHLVSTLIYVKIAIGNLNEAKSEFVAAVTTKITGFCDVMPCSLVHMYRCVRRTCYLRLSSDPMMEARSTAEPSVSRYQSALCHIAEGRLHYGHSNKLYILVLHFPSFFYVYSVRLVATSVLSQLY